MSNPLLRPDDRFRRPELTDAEGRSFFADDAKTSSQPVNENDSNAPILAAPAHDPQAQGGPSYQPQYETVLQHRAGFFLAMSGLGFLFTFGLILPFITIYAGYGIILGFLGVMLCVVAALQSYQELTGISQGAIEPSGRDNLIIAYCLAMGGVVLGIGVILWVVILIFQGVMDLNL